MNAARYCGERGIESANDCTLKMSCNMRLLFTAEVWLGEYQGSKVAIKMLKDLKDEKASQRFLAEASIMT